MNGKRGQIILLLKIILIGLFGAYIFNAVFHTSLASVVGFIVGAYIATKV